MAHEHSTLLSHVSMGPTISLAVEFYTKVLAPLGCKRVMEHPGAVAFGKLLPEFWVQTPIDGKRASIGNGVHFGFVAESKEAVHAFYEAALQTGAKDDGAPALRPDYGEPYYGCFVRDPDGHKIEAAFWDFEVMRRLGWIEQGS